MTYKPNYNDGNWHGWNGGECPVHPKAVVDVRYLKDRPPSKARLGGDWDWSHTGNIGDIIAFRVVKEYREPRTIWAFGAHLFETEEKAVTFRDKLVQENPGRGYVAWPITEFSEVLK